MNLILTIPINVGNSLIAENMIDWIYQLNGRQQSGHGLICYDADVHEERRARVKLTCELAFESFDEIIMPSRNTKDKMASANAARNNLFLGIAEHCQKTFRIPWLWLEPGSCPTNPDWFRNIEGQYADQPRRYMGTHLKVNAESNDRFLHPVSVYHMGAFNDVSRAVTESIDAPFEVVAGPIISMRSTKWRAVQPLKVLDESDFEKVWPQAQIVFGDESGALIEKYRADGVHHTEAQREVNPEWEKATHVIRFAEPAPIVNVGPSPANGQPVKIDRRTRAGRAMIAAQKEQHAHV